MTDLTTQIEVLLEHSEPQSMYHSHNHCHTGNVKDDRSVGTQILIRSKCENLHLYHSTHTSDQKGLEN